MSYETQKAKKQQFSSVKALLKADREKEIGNRAVRQASQYAAIEGA